VTAPIDGTYATYGQLTGGLTVVVWSNIAALRCGTATERGNAIFHGEHGDTSGRQIQWQSQVDGTGAGNVNVNGVEFDLSQGRLLLASSSAGRLITKQLDCEIEQLREQDLVETLRGWLESEAEIRRFFQ
jgi:hypothetical protein